MWVYRGEVLGMWVYRGEALGMWVYRGEVLGTLAAPTLARVAVMLCARDVGV